MKIKIKNIPEGYEIRNKKLVKIMATGGSVTNSTLQPVKREDANVEAEKNETVLTDMDEDGFFELYNVGGKRHSGGGTPLNLPEQSFIYSDTRKMKFTKDEMKELGVTSKKRLTPAAVSKKFPINKYMDVLKNESSDEISITTAEAMIKKNKIKLSQIAFMQEKKKDFEDGLPLAAYPWLLENGVDPKEFEAKLEQKKQEEQQPMHQMPDGTMMPGATHGEAPQQGGQQQPSPEMMQQMMAMQQQGQGMPPQGMPPQGPPQGGQQMPPEMMMAMQQGQQGPPMQGPPQGMMPPQQMMQEGGDYDVNTGTFGKPAPQPIYARYGGNPLAAFVYGGDLPTAQEGGDVIDQNQQNVDMINDIVNCENTVCEYEQWLAQYRLKDIPEVRFMYESYKTKAIDKLKAPNTSTEIMPGHENLKNMPYGNMPGTPPAGSLPGWRETLKGFIPDVIEPYIPFLQEGGSVGTAIDPRQQANMSDEDRQIMGLQQALQQLHQAKLQVVQQFQSNPEAAQNPEAQQQLQNVLMQIEQQTYTVQTQLQYIQEKSMMNETTIPLSDFMPGETTAPANQGSSYEYFNPDRLMRKGGSIGRSIPRFPDGGGTEHTGPESTAFSYEGEDNNGYPVSLNPYYRTSPTSQFLDGVENPNYNADFEQSVDNGIGVHDQFHTIMNSPNFQGVRDEWIKQYQDLDVKDKIKSTDQKKLFKAFNDMNILLNAAFSSGQEFVEGSDLTALNENFSDQLTRIANKMGIETPTKETIMMYQGMYNSLASAKLKGSPQTQALLEQVNINFGDKDGGAYEIIPGS